MDTTKEWTIAHGLVRIVYYAWVFLKFNVSFVPWRRRRLRFRFAVKGAFPHVLLVLVTVRMTLVMAVAHSLLSLATALGFDQGLVIWAGRHADKCDELGAQADSLFHDHDAAIDKELARRVAAGLTSEDQLAKHGLLIDGKFTLEVALAKQRRREAAELLIPDPQPQSDGAVAERDNP